MAEEDVHVIAVPSFTEVLIDGQERTAIRILVEPR
jgi:stage V sporulation protein SpoVS